MKKSVLITAGAKRLGKVIAESMIKKNWSVILHYNSSKIEAEETAHELEKKGGDVSTYQANFLDLEKTEKFIETILKQKKDWFGLINNAGLFKYDSGENFHFKDFNNHMLINFTVPGLLTQALYKKIKRNNSEKNDMNIVINILDAKIFGLNPDYYSYTLSKLSMYGLTKMAALSYAPILRVNGIAPGIILPAKGQNNEQFEKAHKKNLLKKSASIDELKNALYFLINTPSMTGQVLVLDGGSHLYPPRRDVSIDE